MEDHDEGIGSWNYGYGFGKIPPNLDPPLPVPPLPPTIFQQQQQQQQQAVFNNNNEGGGGGWMPQQQQGNMPIPPPPPPPPPPIQPPNMGNNINSNNNKTSFNFLGILGVEEYNSRISEGILTPGSRVGVQVVGKRFEEERVLAVMKVIDELIDTKSSIA